jgi:hypothetical protein
MPSPYPACDDIRFRRLASGNSAGGRESKKDINRRSSDDAIASEIPDLWLHFSLLLKDLDSFHTAFRSHGNCRQPASL